MKKLRQILLQMTRQQLKNSSKMLKKSCMGKNDVTEGKDSQSL